MTQSVEIINRVLPILFLIGLGYWIRRRDFLPESTIDDLRKIAVNLALPSVLFLSFVEMELKLTYLAIFVVVFGLCVALFFLGRGLVRPLKVDHEYFPFLMTGFEYGMLGVSLFGSAYGLEKIGYIAVVDLGHEIFIWFVFLALLLIKRDGLSNAGQLMQAFFTSPVIIGILAGLAFNVLGLQSFLFDGPVTGAVIASMRFLSNLTVPLILIIIGYGLKLDLSSIRETAPVIGIRMVILLPLAILLSVWFVGDVLGLEQGFQTAMFTLLILPPPFIIPLYAETGDEGEMRYVNNVLTLYTIVSLAIFVVYFVLNPTL